MGKFDVSYPKIKGKFRKKIYFLLNLLFLQIMNVSLGSPRGTKVFLTLLLNTLLISFILDSALAANYDRVAPDSEELNSAEFNQYIRPPISYHQNPPDFKPYVWPDDNEPSDPYRREHPSFPLAELLHAGSIVLRESGRVLGLGENFVQDLIEGNENAPSGQQLLAAASKVGNLPVSKFVRYVIAAARQDLDNALPEPLGHFDVDYLPRDDISSAMITGDESRES